MKLSLFKGGLFKGGLFKGGLFKGGLFNIAFFKNKKLWLVVLFVVLIGILYRRTYCNSYEGFQACQNYKNVYTAPRLVPDGKNGVYRWLTTKVDEAQIKLNNATAANRGQLQASLDRAKAAQQCALIQGMELWAAAMTNPVLKANYLESIEAERQRPAREAETARKAAELAAYNASPAGKAAAKAAEDAAAAKRRREEIYAAEAAAERAQLAAEAAAKAAWDASPAGKQAAFNKRAEDLRKQQDAAQKRLDDAAEVARKEREAAAATAKRNADAEEDARRRAAQFTISNNKQMLAKNSYAGTSKY